SVPSATKPATRAAAARTPAPRLMATRIARRTGTVAPTGGRPVKQVGASIAITSAAPPRSVRSRERARAHELRRSATVQTPLARPPARQTGAGTAADSAVASASVRKEYLVVRIGEG